MRLLFTGHNNHRVENVPLETLGRRCERHGGTGCFKHNGQWSEEDNVLRVTFSPVIYINSGLDETAAADALSHEQRHLRDFQTLVRQLQRDIRRVIAQRRYSYEYMRDRWAWFLYDICSASRTYHQSLGAMVEICSEPGPPRP
ncbi:MAG: hypothetical protein HZB61_00435 [Nitrospirae bacterium]|nr:hypothetical protein [Nitrospirota bacterium]